MKAEHFTFVPFKSKFAKNVKSKCETYTKILNAGSDYKHFNLEV